VSWKWPQVRNWVRSIIYPDIFVCGQMVHSPHLLLEGWTLVLIVKIVSREFSERRQLVEDVFIFGFGHREELLRHQRQRPPEPSRHTFRHSGRYTCNGLWTCWCMIHNRSRARELALKADSPLTSTLKAFLRVLFQSVRILSFLSDSVVKPFIPYMYYFFLSLTQRQKKLKCLSLTRFCSLFEYCRVRLKPIRVDF